MRIFDTPRVYFDRADAGPGGVSALRTDVTGLVGIAERGPAHLAVPVESYRQFQAWFGDTIDNGYLACCAQAFFENGGRRLWAVRVVSEAASTAALTLSDDAAVAPAPAWTIEAASPGVWGNDLSVRMIEVRRAQVRATVDPYDTSRLTVASVAGFGPFTLIEARQPGVPARRAVVASVEAGSSQVSLDRDLAGIDPSRDLRIETVAYNLEVYEAGRLGALFEDLSAVPEHPRYGPAVLRQPWQVIDPRDPEREPAAASSAAAIGHFRIGGNRGAASPPLVVVRERRDGSARRLLRLLAGLPSTLPRPLAGGADGLEALRARDFVGDPVSPLDGDVAQAAARRGLAALEVVDEISLLAVPDIHIQPRAPTRYAAAEPCAPDRCLPVPVLPVAPAPRAVGDVPPRFSPEDVARVQAAMVLQCERRRDRVALLDAPFEACTRLSFAVSELRAWRRLFDSPLAALYAPWLDVVDPRRRGDAAGATRPVPPCGHVAGMIAANDLRRGVHVAPANVPLRGTQKPTLAFDDERHGILNTAGVNLIRAESGRGSRVLGARTLSSDTDWRFLSVRRLVTMVARSIEVAIQWAVFEPNDWRTQAKLALVLGSFLLELWSRGALVGATPGEGFFVRCDETNNPASSRQRGELLAEVGLAPSVPFEFIVLRIGREANGFAVTEAGTRVLA
jgi:hypothetical protein